MTQSAIPEVAPDSNRVIKVQQAQQIQQAPIQYKLFVLESISTNSKLEQLCMDLLQHIPYIIICNKTGHYKVAPTHISIFKHISAEYSPTEKE